MIARKTTAIGVILVVVIGLAIVGVLLNSLFSSPPQVPPSPESPGEEPEIIIVNGLKAWAVANHSQDFMPGSPEEGHPFRTLILLNITNIGNTTVTDFHAVRVTIYYNDTGNTLVTLNLVSRIQYFIWPQIGPNESIVFEYINTEESVFSPSIDEGTPLYSRVLTRWENDNQMILTTPPSALLYTS